MRTIGDDNMYHVHFYPEDNICLRAILLFANTSSNGRQRQNMEERNNMSPQLPTSAIFVGRCLLVVEKWIECLID